MDDCGRTDILFSYHAERGNYEKKFMNSRSEAEGRAWLAINSLHHNLYKFLEIPTDYYTLTHLFRSDYGCKCCVFWV